MILPITGPSYSISSLSIEDMKSRLEDYVDSHSNPLIIDEVDQYKFNIYIHMGRGVHMSVPVKLSLSQSEDGVEIKSSFDFIKPLLFSLIFSGIFAVVAWIVYSYGPALIAQSLILIVYVLLIYNKSYIGCENELKKLSRSDQEESSNQ